MTDLLRVEALCAGYGQARVLDGISFAMKPGESLALLGRNGVGKSTLIRSLMGLTKRHSGSVFFGGADLSAASPTRRARAGLGWAPQERAMFPSLTVEEHLTTTARPGPWTLEKIYEVFPRLRERRLNMGDQLSGGEQQMVAIARALTTNPRLLLLDEPMEGLAPIIVQELAAVIGRLIREGGMAAIVVEQHARLALSMTERAMVLDRGRVVHESSSESLLRDSETLGRLVAVAA
ncbi:ABC transporter ATP-binding protein [Neomegalonema perideroedes]|uniref:ABC transporter ATP-binding protein n=1 Tax=Neomegalonema perideroedes TaxID=217219 RepID=UPI00037F2BE8|nr:ABC transporter ATP-binding protein [Neomegalonema perideroedes]